MARTIRTDPPGERVATLVRFTSETHAALKAEADRRGISMNWLVREAVESLLATPADHTHNVVSFGSTTETAGSVATNERSRPDHDRTCTGGPPVTEPEATPAPVGASNHPHITRPQAGA